jgi:hypothetical protein
MFASGASKLIIAASAVRLFGVRVDGVLLVAVLGRDVPQAILFGESGFVGDFKTALLSGVHRVFSFLGKHTAEAYNLGCLGHIASAVWLNGAVRCYQHLTAPQVVPPARIEPATYPYEGVALSTELRG